MPYTGKQGIARINNIDLPVTNWSLDETINAIDVTHIKETTPAEARRYISDALTQMSGSCILDLTDAIGKLDISDGQIMTFYFEDARFVAFSGDLVISSTPVTVEVGDKVNASIEFTVDGETQIGVTAPRQLQVTGFTAAGGDLFNVTGEWLIRNGYDTADQQQRISILKRRAAGWLAVQTQLVGKTQTLISDTVVDKVLDLEALVWVQAQNPLGTFSAPSNIVILEPGGLWP
jgi:hypothetical protein